MHPAYAAIEAIAKKLGYPEHWEDDVYCWDRQFIEKHKPSSFAWCIRQNGSHIIHLGPEIDTPINLEYAKAITNPAYDGQKHFYYVWHGSQHNDPHLTHCRDTATWLEMIRDAEKTRAYQSQRRLAKEARQL